MAWLFGYGGNAGTDPGVAGPDVAALGNGGNALAAEGVLVAELAEDSVELDGTLERTAVSAGFLSVAGTAAVGATGVAGPVCPLTRLLLGTITVGFAAPEVETGKLPSSLDGTT